MNTISKFTKADNLILQIALGIIIGIALALISPQSAAAVGLLGELFVSALKAVAPVLVFILIMASIANQKAGNHSHIRPIIHLYLIGTFLAALTAVIASFAFPTSLELATYNSNLAAPEGIKEIFRTLLNKIVDNPINALLNANYIGLLAWAICLGFALRQTSESTKTVLSDLSHGVTMIVKGVIRLAPIGIFGLVSSTIAATGFDALLGYAKLLTVLIGSMLFIALVVNPIIVFCTMRKNPYPLVFQCLRESGIPAFFTRSSAANIPINMALAEKLNLHKNTYSVSIPLGATVNMAGAAITITVLTLAAAHTLNIETSFGTALLLSLVAAISACGASGVAGGSLLLIPLACDLFGIPNDIAMQVVAIGFIIGVLQDSAETALNSSTDILFTSAVCLANKNE